MSLWRSLIFSGGYSLTVFLLAFLTTLSESLRPSALQVNGLQGNLLLSVPLSQRLQQGADVWHFCRGLDYTNSRETPTTWVNAFSIYHQLGWLWHSVRVVSLSKTQNYKPQITPASGQDNFTVFTEVFSLCCMLLQDLIH